MKDKLKNIIYLIIINTLSLSAQDTQYIKKMREPGDQLDISISQELEHASYNGVKWLKKQQATDGSFGGQNKIICTAVTIMALSLDGDLKNTEVIKNAAERLTQELQNINPTNISECAWVYAALSLYPQSGIKKKPLYATKELLIKMYPGAEGNSKWLCNEVLISTGQSPNSLNLARKEVCEKNYYTNEISLLDMWLNTRSINSKGGQLLTNEGKQTDWREKYAQKLIGSQKIVPTGGGLWKGDSPAETIYNTAIAIMISKEL